MIADKRRRKPAKRRWNHKPVEFYPSLEQLAARYQSPREMLAAALAQLRGVEEGLGALALTGPVGLPPSEVQADLQAALGQVRYAVVLLQKALGETP